MHLKGNFSFVGNIYILYQECTWYFLHKEKYKLFHLVCLTFRPWIILLFDLLISCVIWAVKGTIELTFRGSWEQAVNSQVARHRLSEVYLQHNCLWTTSCDTIICLTKNLFCKSFIIENLDDTSDKLSICTRIKSIWVNLLSYSWNQWVEEKK